MKTQKADDVLIYMIDILSLYLEELSDVSNNPSMQFCYGEKTAYTECLEMLQHWEKAKENGLYFDIEKKYPL